MAEPKRQWWRKKRWCTVAALWLALPVLYVASGGPAWYAFNRGWLSSGIAGRFILPFRVHSKLPEPLDEAYYAYLNWWGRLSD